MTRFFYFFLLHIILFCGSNNFDAHLLDPEHLNKFNFEINDLKLDRFETINHHKKLYKRNIEESGDQKEKSKGIKWTEKKEHNHNEMNKPFYSYSFQNYPSPASSNRMSGNIGKVNKHEISGKVYPEANTKWKDDFCLDDCKDFLEILRDKRQHKREIHSRFKFPLKSKKRRYVDYTNSQMPFNEGKIQHKSSKMKNHKIAEKEEKINNNLLGGTANLKDLKFKRKTGRSKSRRTDVHKSQANNFEIPIDDVILEFSRVRRFLDHERTKKRIRNSATLEAKEAAMSRVLDPNLNLDGILEPHVRKRRIWYIRQLGKIIKKRLKKIKPKNKHHVRLSDDLIIK